MLYWRRQFLKVDNVRWPFWYHLLEDLYCTTFERTSTLLKQGCFVALGQNWPSGLEIKILNVHNFIRDLILRTNNLESSLLTKILVRVCKDASCFVPSLFFIDPVVLVGWLSIVYVTFDNFAYKRFVAVTAEGLHKVPFARPLNRKGSYRATCCGVKHRFFGGLIRCTAPFKTCRRYWGPLLTRIPGLPGILTFWGRRFSNVNVAFSVIRSYLHSEIGTSPFIWTKFTWLFFSRECLC